MSESPSDQRARLMERLSRVQRERLSHIDFKLYFLGNCAAPTSWSDSRPVPPVPRETSRYTKKSRQKT